MPSKDQLSGIGVKLVQLVERVQPNSSMEYVTVKIATLILNYVLFVVAIVLFPSIVTLHTYCLLCFT